MLTVTLWFDSTAIVPGFQLLLLDFARLLSAAEMDAAVEDPSTRKRWTNAPTTR